eukprot:6287263-Lingulodinium_polyedra.AAC.1
MRVVGMPQLFAHGFSGVPLRVCRRCRESHGAPVGRPRPARCQCHVMRSVPPLQHVCVGNAAQ